MLMFDERVDWPGELATKWAHLGRMYLVGVRSLANEVFRQQQDQRTSRRVSVHCVSVQREQS